MLHARPEGYVGKQFGEGFTSYIIAGPYCGVISLEEGVTQDEGKLLVESFKQGLLTADVKNLNEFESTISSLILKLNFPAHVALSIGIQINSILYIKTVGDGQIYFRRSNKLDLLLSGDKSASGYLQEFDMVIFTTSRIHGMIGEKQDIHVFVDLFSPREIIEKIQSEEYGEEEQGFVALFVEYNRKKTTVVSSILDEMEPKINDPMAQVDSPQQPITSVPPSISQPSLTSAVSDESTFGADKPSMLSQLRKVARNKLFIVVVVVILFGLLSWSVFFGYERRQAALKSEKIQSVRVDIEAQMEKAQDISFLNLQESLVLLSTAKTNVANLKGEVGESYTSEIAALEKLIADTESSIMKRDEVEAQEFYDLTLESKDAKGDAIGWEEDLVAILDAKKKKVYVFDSEKKSLEEYVNPDLSDVSRVALYNGEVYVFHATKGVMKFTSQTKLTTVIEPDDEWGEIVDLEIYSGNIYLLDAGNEEIYKYLVTEGGFSSKRPYLTTAANLEDATEMIIDSAIYVTSGDNIFKFISGAAEEFSPQLPVENAVFDNVFTSVELELVYVLDRTHASVYVLSKEGVYQRQIQSSVFGKAQGIYIFKDSILVLSDHTIYDVPAN